MRPDGESTAQQASTASPPHVAALPCPTGCWRTAGKRSTLVHPADRVEQRCPRHAVKTRGRKTAGAPLRRGRSDLIVPLLSSPAPPDRAGRRGACPGRGRRCRRVRGRPGPRSPASATRRVCSPSRPPAKAAATSADQSPPSSGSAVKPAAVAASRLTWTRATVCPTAVRGESFLHSARVPSGLGVVQMMSALYIRKMSMRLTTLVA
jgi:hypothetical protein